MQIADLLNEALPLSLARMYVRNAPVYKMHERVFMRQEDGNRTKTRIYIPFSQTVKAKTPPAITRHLKTLGYEVADYVQGLARKIGDPKRVIRIGRLLQDQAALKKKFDNDPNRTGTKAASLSIVISRHPYDYAGMSTGRGWTSCMNLKDGEQNEYVLTDIKLGSLIAYLIRSDDRNIRKPLARIAIRPYMNKINGDVVMYPSGVYGAHRAGFHEAVAEWLSKNYNEGKMGFYCLHPGAYDDEGSSTVTLISARSIIANPVRAAKIITTAQKDGDAYYHDIDEKLEAALKDVPADVLRVLLLNGLDVFEFAPNNPDILSPDLVAHMIANPPMFPTFSNLKTKIQRRFVEICAEPEMFAQLVKAVDHDWDDDNNLEEMLLVVQNVLSDVKYAQFVELFSTLSDNMKRLAVGFFRKVFARVLRWNPAVCISLTGKMQDYEVYQHFAAILTENPKLVGLAMKQLEARQLKTLVRYVLTVLKRRTRPEQRDIMAVLKPYMTPEAIKAFREAR